MTLAVAAQTGGESYEREALGRLLRLYDEEARLYRELRELARRQTDVVRGGGGLRELHELLQAKRSRLDEIARLEEQAAGAKLVWAARRGSLRGGSAAALQEALREVGALIEEILACEAESDRLLLAAAGG